MTTYNENNVPILVREPGSKLGLSEDTAQVVTDAHAAAQEAIEADGADAHAEHLLLGEAVVIHNSDPSPVPYASFTIGASTLDEAAKEVIAGFDLSHVGEPNQSSDHIYPPRWVAATHEDLAEVLANYYSCEVRKIADALAEATA